MTHISSNRAHRQVLVQCVLLGGGLAMLASAAGGPLAATQPYFAAGGGDRTPKKAGFSKEGTFGPSLG